MPFLTNHLPKWKSPNPSSRKPSQMHRANQFYVTQMLLRWQGKQILQFSHTISIPIFNPFTPQLCVHWAIVMWLNLTMGCKPRWWVTLAWPLKSWRFFSHVPFPSQDASGCLALQWQHQRKPGPLSPFLEKTSDQPALNTDWARHIFLLWRHDIWGFDCWGNWH